jgi:hypothetical protein
MLPAKEQPRCASPVRCKKPKKLKNSKKPDKSRCKDTTIRSNGCCEIRLEIRPESPDRCRRCGRMRAP